MKPSHEQLSAYLDGELPAEEQALLREALQQDPDLAEQLEQMRLVDERLRARSEVVSERPLPEAVTQMLAEDKVVSMASWRSRLRGAAAPMALAASLALLIGFGGGVLLDGSQPGGDAQWASIASQLDHVPSGSELALDEEVYLLSRFTFRDQNGQTCRQFQLRSGAEITENVACHQAGGWQRVATVQVDTVLRPEEYQPATAQSLLDGTLRAMMQDGPLGLEEEAELLEQISP